MHFDSTVISAVFHTIYRVLEGIRRFQGCLRYSGFIRCSSCTEFSWLSLYGFYHVLRLVVFPSTDRVLEIRQYAQNTLKFTRPITETF